MNIMLVGESGSGKDLIYSLLPNYHRISLADPIRNIVSILRHRGVGAAFAFSTKLLGDYTPNNLMEILRFYSQIPMTTKEKAVLQGIGTFFVSCKDDVWIKQGISAIQGNHNVITDVRRISEFKTFAALGFKGIWVSASRDVRVQRLLDRDGGHDVSSESHVAESEIGLLREYCAATVINQGSINELRDNVGIVLSRLSTESN